MSFLTFLLWLQRCQAELWENITGALVTRNASSIVCHDTWGQIDEHSYSVHLLYNRLQNKDYHSFLFSWFIILIRLEQLQAFSFANLSKCRQSAKSTIVNITIVVFRPIISPTMRTDIKKSVFGNYFLNHLFILTWDVFIFFVIFLGNEVHSNQKLVKKSLNYHMKLCFTT